MSWMESIGLVYVVTDGEFLKVGETSGCPEERMANLQCGNPRKLRLLRVYETPDRKAAERHCHECLKPWQCPGGSEWFSCGEAELDMAAEDLESLFGAVDVGPCKLPKVPKGEFCGKIIDFWVNGDTLTLALDEVNDDSLNFTLQSTNATSKKAGDVLIARLGHLLGIRNPSADAVLRELRLAVPSWHWREEWRITYRRVKSRWLCLNDFELIHLTKQAARKAATQ